MPKTTAEINNEFIAFKEKLKTVGFEIDTEVRTSHFVIVTYSEAQNLSKPKHLHFIDTYRR